MTPEDHGATLFQICLAYGDIWGLETCWHVRAVLFMVSTPGCGAHLGVSSSLWWAQTCCNFLRDLLLWQHQSQLNGSISLLLSWAFFQTFFLKKKFPFKFSSLIWNCCSVYIYCQGSIESDLMGTDCRGAVMNGPRHLAHVLGCSREAQAQGWDGRPLPHSPSAQPRLAASGTAITDLLLLTPRWGQPALAGWGLALASPQSQCWRCSLLPVSWAEGHFSPHPSPPGEPSAGSFSWLGPGQMPYSVGKRFGGSLLLVLKGAVQIPSEKRGFCHCLFHSCTQGPGWIAVWASLCGCCVDASSPAWDYLTSP